jgi:hypothetical protein
MNLKETIRTQLHNSNLTNVRLLGGTRCFDLPETAGMRLWGDLGWARYKETDLRRDRCSLRLKHSGSDGRLSIASRYSS